MALRLPDIAPYAELHKDPKGQNDARPTALTIVQDQNLVGQLSGLTIAITGADAGLGLETTRALHATGAHIIMLTNNVSSAGTVRDELRSGDLVQPPAKIDIVEFDLAKLESVGFAATEVRRLVDNKLDILVCNAGVMSPPFAATADGFEAHFGVNFLAHFYFVNQLLPALARPKTATPSRVVVVSSLGHRAAEVDFDNFPPLVKDDVTATAAPDGYHQSKTALLWMSNEIDRRYGAAYNIHSLAVNPGSIPTQLTAHIGWEKMRDRMGEHVDLFDKLRKSVPQGAATTVWAAVAKELEGEGGLYLDDVRVALPAEPGSPFFTHGYAPHAYDQAKAQRLWEETIRILAGKGFDLVQLQGSLAQ